MKTGEDCPEEEAHPSSFSPSSGTTRVLEPTADSKTETGSVAPHTEAIKDVQQRPRQPSSDSMFPDSADEMVPGGH